MEFETEDVLLERARAGDSNSLSRLLAAHAPALERMIALRLDARLGRRLEASDILQETLTLAAQRFADWSREQRYPLRLWLRLLATQALQSAFREHHRLKRDLGRESSDIAARLHPTAERAADWYASTHTSPTEAVRRGEMRERVLAALAQLDDIDREVLVLRSFEQLSNDEAALELGIDPAAASKRFARALQRIRPALRGLSDDNTRGAT